MVLEKMSFKDISYLELWGPFVQQRKIICAISIEGIMRNISVKLFSFGQVFQDIALKEISYLIWPEELNHLCNFGI